jgi:hypothetical protein
MKPTLTFSDEHEQFVSGLSSSFDGCPELLAVVLDPSQLPSLEGLDAIFLGLPYAERWGSRPILYKAQVLSTRPDDEGMPPYIVTGVAMHEADPRDARFELRLLIAAILDAVELHNLSSARPIRRIGLWTDMLGMRRLGAKEAGDIIRSMYEGRYTDSA